MDVKLGPHIMALSRSIAAATPAKIREINLSIMDGLKQEDIVEEMLQNFYDSGSLYKFKW